MEIAEQKKVRVPKLRFREFEDGWNSDSIENLSSVITSGSRDWAQFYAEVGDLFVRMTNLSRDGIDLNLNSLKYVQLPPEHSEGTRTGLESGDILISITAELGKIGWVPEDLGRAFINQHTALVRINSKADSKFIAHNLARKSTNTRLNRLNDSGAKSGLNLSTIQGFRLTVPTLPEQQKIASFLSAVDERLGHLARKKQLLEQYKKGVMQQLFSQQLRFKREDGSDYEDWEEKRLGKVGVIVSGLTYSPTDIHDDGVLVLRSSNVHNRQVTFTDNVFVKVEDGAFNPVQLNDILICVRNGSTRLIGKNALISKEAVGKAFGAFMAVYRSKNNAFLFHWFDTPSYKKEVHKNLGATINSINGSDLKKFKVPFPCQEEQQKIADFLSSLDRKIEAVSAQIALTQQFKKGLLQEMFV